MKFATGLILRMIYGPTKTRIDLLGIRIDLLGKNGHFQKNYFPFSYIDHL